MPATNPAGGNSHTLLSPSGSKEAIADSGSDVSRDTRQLSSGDIPNYDIIY
jgi:hypothetical protein